MTERTNFARWISLGVLALLAVSSGAEKARGQVARVEISSDEEFELAIFDQRTASATREKLDAMLQLRIEQIDRECGLADEQKQKLRLMGHGDIKHIFDDFEKAKRQFKLLNNDWAKLDQIGPLIDSVQTAKQEMLESGSLFGKSLRQTLTREQFARYEVMVREQHELQHRAQIELAVRKLEESMPLREAQRRELIVLLGKDIKHVQSTRSFYFYIVMSQIANLSEEKIKPLLTEIQWRIWEKRLGEYKIVIARLRQAGVVFEQGIAEPPIGEKP